MLKINPFFEKVQKYIDKVWYTFKKDKFILSDIYNKKIFMENLSDMNKNKLFNYLIQLTETENNMKVLSKLIPNIDNFKSRLVLYNYDSFLFDFHIEDGVDFLKRVKDAIEDDGKFPVKIAKGWNYHEMEDITEKFK